MKIKRLELCGFKSFVDRTVVNFDHEIMGVVGPNGCGKSNIVDAIRWSMGEQSAKHLRGRSMEDVIFNGSESRSPADFAEVTLTFENDDPTGVPLEYKDYTDIAVTRRLHRSGDSEYLINKTPVRLKDITDLFLGTGIKPAEGMVEAKARAAAYSRAGARGFFVPGLVDLSAICELCNTTDLPLNVMVMPGLADVRELANAGVARISHGPAAYLLAMEAVRDAAQNISE